MPAKKKYFTEEARRAAKNEAEKKRYAKKGGAKGLSEKQKSNRKINNRNYRQRNKDRINLENRKRWANDPGFRLRSMAENRKWIKKNKGHYDEYHKNYRTNNRDLIHASQKSYRERNKEMCAGKVRDYLSKNRDKIRAKERETYRIDPSKHKEKCRLWYKKNPARANEYVMRRRAAMKANPVSSRDEIVAIYEEAARLQVETGVSHEVDHIIPLTSGGWHDHRNLQPMPEKMNGRGGKWNNPFWLSPSPAYKDWRDVPRELWPVDLAPKYLALIEQNKGVSIRWDTAA